MRMKRIVLTLMLAVMVCASSLPAQTAKPEEVGLSSERLKRIHDLSAPLKRERVREKRVRRLPTTFRASVRFRSNSSRGAGGHTVPEPVSTRLRESSRLRLGRASINS